MRAVRDPGRLDPAANASENPARQDPPDHLEKEQ
jgi:hypothetical protein